MLSDADWPIAEIVWRVAVQGSRRFGDTQELSILWAAAIALMREPFAHAYEYWRELSQSKRIETMRGKKYSFENFLMEVAERKIPTSYQVQ